MENFPTSTDPLSDFIKSIVPNIAAELIIYLVNAHGDKIPFSGLKTHITNLFSKSFHSQFPHIIQKSLVDFFMANSEFAIPELADVFLTPVLSYTLSSAVKNNGKLPTTQELEREITRILKLDWEAKKLVEGRRLETQNIAPEFFRCLEKVLAEHQAPGDMVTQIEVQRLGELLVQKLEDIKNIITRDVVSQPPADGGGGLYKHIPVSAPQLLLGRGSVHQEILTALSVNQHVLIYGFGGVGKTALAATVATSILSNPDSYPQGVLWITVLDRPVDSLIEEILRITHNEEYLQRPITERQQIVRRVLGAARLVIVLDDVNDDSKTPQEWIRTIHPPNTPLLVTCRSELKGFIGFELKELARPDAIRLLYHYAGSKTQPNLEKQTANDIAISLGDHPLALEILAEHIRLYYWSDPPAILEELKTAHEKIQTISQGNTKYDSVYISLDLSWQRLDQKEKYLLGNLAAFPAVSTGNRLLELCCGFDDGTFREIIGNLRNKSLIREYNRRWGMHPIIRDFTQAKLSENQDWEGLVKKSIEDVSAGIMTSALNEIVIANDAENMVSIVELAPEHGLYGVPNIAAQILPEYFMRYGYYRESVRLLEFVLFVLKDERVKESPTHHSEHYNKLGLCKFRLGDIKGAVLAYYEAFNIAIEGGLWSSALNAIGNAIDANISNRDWENALQGIDLELGIAKKIGSAVHLTSGYLRLAMVNSNLNRLEDAVVLYMQALEFCEKTGDDKAKAAILTNLANVFGKMGLVDKAIPLYEESLKIAYQSRDYYAICSSLGALGLERVWKDHKRAKRRVMTSDMVA